MAKIRSKDEMREESGEFRKKTEKVTEIERRQDKRMTDGKNERVKK